VRDGRRAGGEGGAEQRLDARADAWEQLAHRAPEVRRDGERVEARQRLVDAHVAQLAVEEAEPHRAGRVHRLELGEPAVELALVGAHRGARLVALGHVLGDVGEARDARRRRRRAR
jgi:hypothetical protein